jgi:glycogen debranching enzyme GlgX
MTGDERVAPSSAPRISPGGTGPERTGPGSPDTLGVTIAGDGIDIAVHAPDADAIAICLFDSTDRETERFRLPARTGPVFHGHIAGVGTGTRYGLRAYGPWDPANGHRFNPSKLLVDPRATAIDRPFRLDPLLFDRDGPRPDDTAGLIPKGIVGVPPVVPVTNRPAFDWDRQVIYELHVRGFTMTHPAIPPGIRGTFAALSHPASVAHLARLGITTVELMPSAAWVDERHLPPLNRSNYWGYNPIAFLAPDPRLAPGGWAEVRTAVDALHEAGLSVILDVVLNHSGESDELGPTLSMRGLDNAGYYRLAGDRSLYVNDAGCGNILAMDRPAVLRLGLDALRAWALYGGVDGFRLDLATTLGRRETGFDRDAPFLAAVEQDPILSRCVMIAEPWDIGPGGYQLGAFPAGWGEWNDRYRDTVRRFWRGDTGKLGEFATRFAGSADVFRGRPLSRSINYIVAHDGFTLADLVSYEAKHNQANGENNRDGTDDNLSWNNGSEGPSSDPRTLLARGRDVRALLATLLLSRGTPMLSMGDELGRTQRGNNNAYAQDNAGSWVDWAAADEALIDDAAALIALRKVLSPVFDGHTLRGNAADGEVMADVAWLGADGQPLAGDDWNRPANRTLIAVLFADGLRAALVFHAGAEAAEVVLPAARSGYRWWQVFEGAGASAVVAARSVAVFREQAERDLASSPVSWPARAPGSAHPPQSQVEDGRADPHGRPDKPPDVERPGWAHGSRPVIPGLDPGIPANSAGRDDPRIKSGDDEGGSGDDEDAKPLLDLDAYPDAYGADPGHDTEGIAPVPTRSPDGVTDPELDRLAELAGIDLVWWDVGGGYHKVGAETKRALLAAMRLPGGTRAELDDSTARLTLETALPPVATVAAGQAFTIPLGQPRPAWVTLLREDGSVERFHSAGREVTLPAQPIGRHRLLNEDRPDRFCHLTVAPAACYLPPALLAGERRFGIAAHLYALRSKGDQGIGDFSTLSRLATEAARVGASVLGLNPLHALFPHDRSRASPYSPSDRRFLDPIYIDVSGFPGGAAIPSPSGPVDYGAVWASKREVLLSAFRPGGGEAMSAGLRRFATFEAITAILDTPDWTTWPTELRHPDHPAVAAFAAQHRETVEFHAFLQRLADKQLAEAAASASRDGLSLGFYRDLAVGAAPDGAEAWSAQDTLMHGVSVGAPPDPFSANGQVWSLPPPDPVAMRRDGFTAFNELLVANMRHAGALRIDHVMGLRRLFVVPDGAGAIDGAYVAYPLTDLLAQVALESQRAHCLVVGEDLGTVPEGMSERLAQSNVLSYSVLWFERRAGRIRRPAEWRRLAAACVTTHDLPTLTGWWNGADIAEKRVLSLIGDDGAEQVREAEKRDLIALLREENLLAGDVDVRQPMPVMVAAAIHAFVSATPSLLALVQADDLAGEVVAVNLPGTDRERPNWRRRLETDVEALCRTPLARAILLALRARSVAVPVVAGQVD